jgi:hypothetical protein
MAHRQTLKDARFNVLGFIETDADGQQTILDAQFRRLGSYDPKTNVSHNGFTR